MKYFLCLLMLTTIAYAQDSSLIYSNGLTTGNYNVIHISLDTPWLLSHGWELVDSVKWKPYYQKKKHHHWFPGMESIEGYKEASKAMDSIFSNGDLIVKGTDVQLGGPLTNDTAINGIGVLGRSVPPYPYAVTKNAVTSTHWIRDTLFSAKGFRVWEPTEPYPWWKKALWLLLGQLTMLITYLIIIKYPRHFTP